MTTNSNIKVDTNLGLSGLGWFWLFSIITVSLALFGIKVKADCRGSRALVEQSQDLKRLVFAVETLANVR